MRQAVLLVLPLIALQLLAVARLGNSRNVKTPDEAFVELEQIFQTWKESLDTVLGKYFKNVSVGEFNFSMPIINWTLPNIHVEKPIHPFRFVHVVMHDLSLPKLLKMVRAHSQVVSAGHQYGVLFFYNSEDLSGNPSMTDIQACIGTMRDYFGAENVLPVDAVQAKHLFAGQDLDLLLQLAKQPDAVGPSEQSLLSDLLAYLYVSHENPGEKNSNVDTPTYTVLSSDAKPTEDDDGADCGCQADDNAALRQDDRALWLVSSDIDWRGNIASSLDEHHSNAALVGIDALKSGINDIGKMLQIEDFDDRQAVDFAAPLILKCQLARGPQSEQIVITRPEIIRYSRRLLTQYSAYMQQRADTDKMTTCGRNADSQCASSCVGGCGCDKTQCSGKGKGSTFLHNLCEGSPGAGCSTISGSADERCCAPGSTCSSSCISSCSRSRHGACMRECGSVSDCGCGNGQACITGKQPASAYPMNAATYATRNGLSLKDMLKAEFPENILGRDFALSDDAIFTYRKNPLSKLIDAQRRSACQTNQKLKNFMKTLFSRGKGKENAVDDAHNEYSNRCDRFTEEPAPECTLISPDIFASCTSMETYEKHEKAYETIGNSGIVGDILLRTAHPFGIIFRNMSDDCGQ